MQHPDQEANSGSLSLAVGKSDSASEAGDDASSVKSGSAISNLTSQQSHDPLATTSGALSINSSSPWSSSSALQGLESGPWGNNSSTSNSLGNFGWNTIPSSLSMSSNNQGLGHSLQPNIGGSSSFNSTIGNSSSGWPTGISSNPLSSSSGPLNLNNGLQSGSMSSQWNNGSSMLGNIDFPKSSESNWNNPTNDIGLNKENSTDPRMWGLSSEKPPDGQWPPSKPQWANSPIGAGSDQGDQLSFAQAALKGIKPPLPKPVINLKNEEILRAIENHEGWGSRPINQETSWDIETSPKSHRKFSAENATAQASNVWNNRNGTAIWDSVRDNNSWGSNASSAPKAWNGGEKEQSSWGAMPKQTQDSWGPGNAGNAGGGDSKSFGMWGGPGAGGDASSKMWGPKPENRSWGMDSNGRSGAISSWGDDDTGGNLSNWGEDPRRQAGIGGSMPGLMPPNAGMSGPGMHAMNSQGMPNMQGMPPDNSTAWNDTQKSGWNSANAGMQRPKIDEPWNKPPPKITGWGDPVPDPVKIDDGTSLWGSGGKQMPSMNQPKPSGWGDSNGPQGQWNAAVGTKPKLPSGWDEASYAMAQRQKMVQPKYSNSGGGHTQMRAKLLQQLMDMGFRKEEAQNALITNNMNLEMAINDLNSNGKSRNDINMDMYHQHNTQRMPPFLPKNELSDNFSEHARSDQVPNFNTSLQNTPLSNAQTSNHFLQNSTSLPPSSLSSNANSINHNASSKMIQKMQVAPPGSNATGTSGNMPQPEQIQHVFSQIRQAINSGIIPPQLLNYSLPRNMLVLIQQLLQLQTARQTLVARLQHQNRMGMRPPIDQHNVSMNNINTQIVSLQKQLQHAQTVFFSSQKPPNMSQPPSGMMSQSSGALAENIDAISSELANASIGNQSRLHTQWKPGTDIPHTESSLPLSSTSNNDLLGDKANPSIGSNYVNLIGGGLGITGDPWSSVSSSSSQNWPSTSSESINTTATSSAPTSSGLSGLTDVIPEFIPGKPWQGLSKSNVEDDPHITPGSIQRSLSVNRVHDDSLNSLSSSKFDKSSWYSSSKNDNSFGLGNLGSRPPPVVGPPKAGTQSWQQGGNPVYSRQASWAGRSGNSAFTQVGASNWNDSQSMSNWIVLKNLGFMDQATTRALSQRYGDVINFYYIPENQAALIQYGSRDVAMNAQRNLNNFTMGNSTLKADFISEMDAQKAVSQLSTHAFQQNMPINTSQWSHAPPSSGYTTGMGNRGEIWSQASNPWGGPSLWGDSSISDQNCNPILSQLGGILD